MNRLFNTVLTSVAHGTKPLPSFINSSTISSRPYSSSNGNNNNNNDIMSDGKSWRKLLFTDLHVSTKTLDRTLSVLEAVRKRAVSERCPVVFLGDFWHQRNILHVRHIDRLLQEFDEWRRDGVQAVFIPGNHDQVSVDGAVHGMQLFGLFDNIRVATEPIFDRDEGCAYLPWREGKDAQRELFRSLDDVHPLAAPKWTVFAHAEVKGARSNGGHRATGKIDDEGMNNLRACYLGHYHGRQQVATNAWYIGSPYQQNFGEMNDPHGIALVESGDNIHPHFIDLDQMPRHWKLEYPADFVKDTGKSSLVNEKDIVEVRSTRDIMRQPEYIGAIDSLPLLTELRRVMVSKEEDDPTASQEDGESRPSKAGSRERGHLKLEDFLKEYVEMNAATHGWTPEKTEEIVAAGKEILGQVKETAVTPLGRKVTIKRLVIQDFCSIRGNLELALEGLTMVMIKGRMGIGKSSIFEALVWAIYGATSPRKQATSSASIKGDEVINDTSKSTTVTLWLDVDGKEISISRSKKRGHGSKVEITGLDDGYRQGIADQQSAIHNIIGLDYDLFRMCVYLGQGSISNFVTDTDKRRKELLSRAFSLGMCIPAAKIAKESRKKQETMVGDMKQKRAQLAASLDTWLAIDYDQELAQWSESRKIQLAEHRQQLQLYKDKLEQLKQDQGHNTGQEISELELERENAQNELASAEYDYDEWTKEQSAKTIKTNTDWNVGQHALTNIQREIQKCKDVLQRAKRYISAKESDTTATCTECGQSLDTEVHQRLACNNEIKMAALQGELDKKKKELEALDVERASLARAKREQTQAVNEQRSKLRDQIKRVTQQLGNTSKHGIELLEQSIKERESQIRELEKDPGNPFATQQRLKEDKINQLSKDIEKIDSALDDVETKRLETLQFWEAGFGSDGISVLALNQVIKEVEGYANEYLSILSQGKLFTTLAMHQDELTIEVFELDSKNIIQPRSFYQLSGGQRRCVELSYSPFALSEVIFNHVGSRVTLMVVDELTNHLDATIKPIICELLRQLPERESIVVVDHDASVQSEFDHVFSLDIDQQTNQHTLQEV
ncbi:hypothetical protein SAMD00019534_067830 [Acytostelium subglobosum LB1]|uniref:hypothetical protein n=1 Tax=Acytostelium subglobosum LB1 TaxID=1410327 RepID=UPI000644E7F1|nr:hypothetical protein SAMD00019534_067830 [Acytostelium subglobosum LB1]GAM23608.1 hypothetical protein SAMD00019534_067830 [Acytostelium subglobosum LB1]|eukprot:XP_012753349.1 hypothetical protein SAMD00019534_067830 [Acytostelium subglobosum LB1]